MSLIKRLQNINIQELIPTPDGCFTVKYNDKFVHSSRSPLKESGKLLTNIEKFSPEDTLVIAWGTGLGYHIEKLIELGFDVVAIEPRKEIAEIFAKVFPLENLIDWIDDESLVFDKLVQLKKYYKNFVDISMIGFPIQQSTWELKTQALTAIRSLHAIKKNIIDSWYLNILQNVSLLNSHNIGYTNTPIFQNQELIICSAGPSLKESLPYLQKNRDKFIILSVDTALLTLLEADIIPDYVHAVDAKIHNIADFRGIDSSIFSQITLIADLTLNSQVVCLPWKRVLFVSTAQPLLVDGEVILSRHHLLQYLWDENLRLPETQTGGSVATSAFHLGVLYKAKKILLVGQDLAYSNHRGHAVGSSYDKEYRVKTNRLKTLDTIHIHKIPFNSKPRKGIQEEFVYTDHLLNQFCSWFEVSLRDNKELQNICINASENGSYFESWKHCSLNLYKAPTEVSTIIEAELLSYDKEFIQNILSKLNNILADKSHPVTEDFFYKEKYSPYTEKQINKKIKQWKQKTNLNK